MSLNKKICPRNGCANWDQLADGRWFCYFENQDNWRSCKFVRWKKRRRDDKKIIKN
jgi:hypothetical protein